MLRQTVKHVLRPGLYRLIAQDSCEKPGLFEPDKFFGLGNGDGDKVVTTVTWETIKL
jgi:hypothetical protein